MRCALSEARYKKNIDRTEISVITKGHVVDELWNMPNAGMELISHPQYDRLLNIEGECQRLRSGQRESIELLELLVRYLSEGPRHPGDCTCMVCRARAAIARAKGEGK